MGTFLLLTQEGPQRTALYLFCCLRPEIKWQPVWHWCMSISLRGGGKNPLCCWIKTQGNKQKSNRKSLKTKWKPEEGWWHTVLELQKRRLKDEKAGKGCSTRKTQQNLFSFANWADNVNHSGRLWNKRPFKRENQWQLQSADFSVLRLLEEWISIPEQQVSFSRASVSLLTSAPSKSECFN